MKTLHKSYDCEVTQALEHQLDIIEIKTSVARAKIALQGAQIFHCRPIEKTTSLLWCSPDEDFTLGKPIRGGIPICRPWFGAFTDNDQAVQQTNVYNREASSHGVVRTALWKLDSINAFDDGNLELKLVLNSAEVKILTGFQAELEVTICIGKKLRVSFQVKNLQPNRISYTTALHSYFPVSNIKTTKIIGFQNARYFDGITRETGIDLNPNFEFLQETETAFFKAADCQIASESSDEQIVLNSEGSNSTMVWNPWHEKSKRLSNFPDHAYKEMLCIETANIYDDYISLGENESHTLSVTISGV